MMALLSDHTHSEELQSTSPTSLEEPLLSSSSNIHENNNHNNNDDDQDDSKNITLCLPSCCCACCCRDNEINNNSDNNDDGNHHRHAGGRIILVKMNHNVVLNLLLCILYGLSDSLWSGTVTAAYLKKLGHDQNSWVGNVEAANGMASLLSALPVGYLADHMGRSIVLKGGGMLLVVTALLHAAVLQWIGTDETQEHPHSEWALAGIMALWGIGGGIVSGPAQALFADSTPHGKRSLYYMYLFTCYEVASCMGPLISIVLFQTLGDDWGLKNLRIILWVGMGMEVVNGIVMMFFDDSKALEEGNGSSDDDDDDDEGEEECNQDNNNTNINTTNNSTTPPPLAAAADEEQPPPQQNSSANNNNTNNNATTTNSKTWMIPYIIFMHSLVFALGSGMTVKFFPLFFKDQVGMSPSQVQGVYFLVPLVMAACSGIGQTIATQGGLGRVPTALMFKILGVMGLYSMVVFKSYLDHHPVVLVPIYILRTALMNASYPLEESILMDYVPKQERARWKSLESIAAFGWCGSAALGGWASDHAHGDYTYTFQITAIIQTLGILTWALLLPLVPRVEGHDDNNNNNNNNTGPCNGSRNNGNNTTNNELAAAAAEQQLCLTAAATADPVERALQEPLLSQATAAAASSE